MFKSLTMLAGGALGVSMAVAAGAPPPARLLSHLDGKLLSQVTSATSGGGGATGPGSCSTGWGTGSQGGPGSTGAAGRPADVRAGVHPCFDRLVVDLGAGRAPGYQVRYAGGVHALGSGRHVSVAGGAVLDITIGAPAGLNSSAASLTGVAGFPVLRQVAGAGSAGGQTQIAVGVSGRLPFRVQVLSGPGAGSRLVIDIAHGQ
jgi:hypothetical protein